MAISFLSGRIPPVYVTVQLRDAQSVIHAAVRWAPCRQTATGALETPR